jgi:hypothetical protein
MMMTMMMVMVVVVVVVVVNPVQKYQVVRSKEKLECMFLIRTGFLMLIFFL